MSTATEPTVEGLNSTEQEEGEEDADIPFEPYHDEVEQEERPTQSDGEEEQPQVTIHEATPTTAEEPNPTRARIESQNSYEASVVSTSSAPPPYELYPPATTVLGKAWNWLRQIPRLNTHQAIYLPTIHNSSTRHSGRSIFSRRRRRSDSQSTASSNAPSTVSVSWWSYCYYNITDRLPECPRLVLPHFLDRYRITLIFASVFFLALSSFLLFCSIFFAPAPLPDPIWPDKVTNGTAAKFLTLNIFMRPPLIKNNWSDYKDDRLAYIEKYILPEYDVIAFEESFAFATRRKDRLIRSALELGYNYHVESPRKYPWQIGVDGGLLLISRFPIRQANVVEYPRGQHSDWFSVKGALHALIELNPNRKMHLYSTHTQASYDLNNVINEDDTIIRLSQFSLLHNFIFETSRNDKEPIMIMGDLNVDAAVHPKDRPITQPSEESSSEYTKMVEVIKGTGVERSDSNGRWFAHFWKLLDLQDVVYQNYGYHPVTFGDYTLDEQGELIPAETVLTNWDQFMTVQSIDRIFWSDRETGIIKPVHPRVQKFWVKENQKMSEEEKRDTEFTQISDHYGISIDVQIV